MKNYYEILNIDSTATQAEIEDVWEVAYNQARRLVTHHDPQVVLQANQDLQTLQQIRDVLTDPGKRAAYDVSLNLNSRVGGLQDLEAIPQQTQISYRPTPPLQSGTLQQDAVERVDAWMCPKCGTPNATGKRFCKHCGEVIGTECLNCERVVEAAALFCSECGMSKEDAERARQLEEQKKRELQRREIERGVLLEDMRKRSESARNWTQAGCFLGFFFLLLGIPLWIVGLVKASSVLALSQVEGDVGYRSEAKNAARWAVVGLVLVVIWLILVVVYVVSQEL